jgi:C-terminal processing protease CtpA/Prc
MIRRPPPTSIGSQVSAGAAGWVLQHPVKRHGRAFFVLLMTPLLGGLALSPHRPTSWWSGVYVPAALADTLAPAVRSGREVMTREKIEDLVLLGKVWGFVKYNHPRLASGELSCDRELLRIIPAVQQARDRDETRRILVSWLDEVGDPAPCSSCAKLPDSIQSKPRIDWIRDRSLLGRDLSDRLRKIHDNRPANPDDQSHVDLNKGVGNPVFYEASHDSILVLSDARYRLLALFRFLNIIEYWYPHRDVADEDWDRVMAEFVPRMLDASTPQAYRLALLALTARTHDTHAGLLSCVNDRPPGAEARLPILVRWVESRVVVTGFPRGDSTQAGGLRLGDVILLLDGVPVDSLMARWREYYAASNDDVLRRDLAGSIPWGPAGPCRVGALRESGPFEATLVRAPVAEANRTEPTFHDLSGDTFQMLTPEIAYLNLRTLSSGAIAGYLQKAETAAGIVLDLRSYPRSFLPFTLGGHFVDQATDFVCFTHGDLTNPGTFVWSRPSTVQPLTPRFHGRVAILVDESSQSLAEYTAMALQASPGALVVGSTTAGADGNVSYVYHPGRYRGAITGIGVFYPNRRPAQRAGIKVDVKVRPTIAGIRARRDEVVEAAVEKLLGRSVDLGPRLMDR